MKKVILESEGEHLKYIDLNIVKTKNRNMITIGKAYKYYVAKEYLRYLEIDISNEEGK